MISYSTRIILLIFSAPLWFPLVVVLWMATMLIGLLCVYSDIEIGYGR
jgi:hypothetical protein